MSPRHVAPDGRLSGERLVHLGAALFGVGAVAVVVAVIPVLLGSAEAPDVPTLVAGLLLPLGMGVALAGLLRGARARRRAARRSSTPT